MLTRMARLLTRMARMARMLTRMTRWLAYYTYSQLSPIPLSFSLPLHLPPCRMHAKDAHVANYAISTKYYFVQN